MARSKLDNGDDKFVMRRIERIKESKDIYPEDKKLVLNFLSFHKTGLGLSKPRYLRAFYSGERVAKAFKKHFKKSMKKAEHEDIVELMNLIDNSKLTDKKASSHHTKRDFKYFVKRFYQYLAYIENGHKLYIEDNYPSLVDWIKPSKGCRSVTPVRKKDLLTRDELDKLVDVAPNFKRKTFYRVAYEAGLRIGEIWPLRIKDISFDNKGASITIKEEEELGKHLKNRYAERVVFITGEASVMLKKYKRSHPYRDNGEAFLWLDDTKKGAYDAWKPDAIRRALERDLKKIGINRKEHKVNPTAIFRHSRQHELYKEGVSSSVCKRFAGHSPDSRMEAVYTHLDDEDVAEELQKHYGLIDKEDTKTAVCKNCGENNMESWLFCQGCGEALREDMKVALAEGKYIKREEYEEKMEKFARLLHDMQLVIRFGDRDMGEEAVKEYDDENIDFDYKITRNKVLRERTGQEWRVIDGRLHNVVVDREKFEEWKKRVSKEGGGKFWEKRAKFFKEQDIQGEM
ncbi:tyrosine-type recombinase/integrase [Candidatus Altiarchaeota archaeon]